ncbi:PH domain-containing protein [Peptococcaceae bacterium 1198_IL3148]
MFFPSKKDLWLSLIIWGTIILCIVPPIVGGEYVALLIMLPIAVFMLWFWYTTGYQVADGDIVVKYGPIKKRVPIKEISKINKTKNPISAPALSMDRLEIIYGKHYDMVLISPVRQQEFIDLLLQENPDIRYAPTDLSQS